MGGAAGTCSFVGSHLDVVPANPETWEVDPFKLTVDGDKLFGRGTTDCLGHVAMITDMFCTIAELKPELDVAVIACFIASEESTAIADVGVDMLVKEGKLEHLKKGPVFWCEHASQPALGAPSHAGLRAGATRRTRSPASARPRRSSGRSRPRDTSSTPGCRTRASTPSSSAPRPWSAPLTRPPAPPMAATPAERCGGAASGGAPEAVLRGLPRARTGEGLRLCDAVHDEADADQVRGGGREPAAAVDRVPGEHSRLQTAVSLGCVFTPMPRCPRGIFA